MADALGTRVPAAAFDEAAASYDSDFAGTTPGLWLRQSVWGHLRPFVRPGMQALDLGCGTGEDAQWLARNGCHVTAADGSAAMLEQVAAKASGLHLERRVRTIGLDLNASFEIRRRLRIPSIWWSPISAPSIASAIWPCWSANSPLGSNRAECSRSSTWDGSAPGKPPTTWRDWIAERCGAGGAGRVLRSATRAST